MKRKPTSVGKSAIISRKILQNTAQYHTSTPLVSVCIPAYFGETHIAQAIASILNQTMSDLELLVIDDNSSDGTERVVESFHDPRIKYSRNPVNLGPEGNWNLCLREACGRYVKLLPQDDFLYADTLRRQVAILENDADENISFVFGPRIIVDDSGREIMRRGYRGQEEGEVLAADLIRRCVRLGTNLIGEPGSVIFRRTLADRVGLFDGEMPYVIDLDYWFRLLRYGDAYYLRDPVSAFRVGSDSWSVRIGAGQSADFRKFIDKTCVAQADILSRLDIMSGKVMARINNLMRLLFYQTVLRSND